MGGTRRASGPGPRNAPRDDNRGGGVISGDTDEQRSTELILSSAKSLTEKVAKLTRKWSRPERLAEEEEFVNLEEVERRSERIRSLTQRQKSRLVINILKPVTKVLKMDFRELQEEADNLEKSVQLQADLIRSNSASLASSPSSNQNQAEAADGDFENEEVDVDANVEQSMGEGSQESIRTGTGPRGPNWCIRTAGKGDDALRKRGRKTTAAPTRKKGPGPKPGRRAKVTVSSSSPADADDDDADYDPGMDENQIWSPNKSSNRRKTKLDNSNSAAARQDSKKKKTTAPSQAKKGPSRSGTFDPFAGEWTDDAPKPKKGKRNNKRNPDVVLLQVKKPKPPTTSVFSQARFSPPRSRQPQGQGPIRMADIKVEEQEAESEPEIQVVDVANGRRQSQAPAGPESSTQPLFPDDDDDSMTGPFESQAQTGGNIITIPLRTPRASAVAAPAFSSRFIFLAGPSAAHSGATEAELVHNQPPMSTSITPLTPTCSSSSSSSSITSLPRGQTPTPGDSNGEATASQSQGSQDGEQLSQNTRRKFKINIKPKEGESYLDSSAWPSTPPATLRGMYRQDPAGGEGQERIGRRRIPSLIREDLIDDDGDGEFF